MEPMTLGSPGSPSPSGAGGGVTGPGSSNFLPLYLMGDNSQPATPRSNTLSPTRGRTQLAFGSTPRGSGSGGAASPNDFNRSLSVLQQRSLFGGASQQQHQPHHQQQSQHHHHHQQLNASLSGPPTMGLFDSLKATGTAAANNNTGTPRGAAAAHNSLLSTSVAANFSAALSNSSYAYNDSFQTTTAGGAADPYMSPGPCADFNLSRLTSPTAAGRQQHEFRTPYGDAGVATSPLSPLSPRQATAPFWVTVFGFPPASVSAILAHFAQCGSIVDKVLPPNGGNWMHLRYASRVDCDKAVNFNERVIGNSMMIGVVYCRDAEIVDKENGGGGGEQLQQQRNGSVPVNRVRPLTQSAYHSSLSPTEVVLSPPMPKRSTGLVNKAMDMIFGW